MQEQDEGLRHLRPRLVTDMLAIVALSAVVVLLVAYTEGLPRIVFGLAFVLFSPGYVFVAALFPDIDRLHLSERLALSFALSLCMVALLGIALNYSPWGVYLTPVLIGLLLITVAGACIVWYRRGKAMPAERPIPRPNAVLLQVVRAWTGQRRRDKVLIVLAVIVVIISLGTVAYVGSKPKLDDRFTEFFVLGNRGKAMDYPRVLNLFEKGSVILGVTNHEYETTTYRIEISIDGDKVSVIEPIELRHGQEWERETLVSPTRVGQHQEVKFSLYKVANDEPYSTLHIWIDVGAGPR